MKQCTLCPQKAAANKTKCEDCLRRNREYMKKYLRIPGKREEARERSRKSKEIIRKTLVEKLGGKCVCCGESEYEFLNFDHKHNDGAAHRKELGIKKNSNSLYRLMRDSKKVLSRFQLLCWNCNCSKGIYGYCPHSLKGVNVKHSR